MVDLPSESQSKVDRFDKVEFQDSLDEFFELALRKVETDEMSVERFGRFLTAAIKLS